MPLFILREAAAAAAAAVSTWEQQRPVLREAAWQALFAGHTFYVEVPAGGVLIAGKMLTRVTEEQVRAGKAGTYYLVPGAPPGAMPVAAAVLNPRPAVPLRVAVCAHKNTGPGLEYSRMVWVEQGVEDAAARNADIYVASEGFLNAWHVVHGERRFVPLIYRLYLAFHSRLLMLSRRFPKVLICPGSMICFNSPAEDRLVNRALVFFNGAAITSNDGRPYLDKVDTSPEEGLTRFPFVRGLHQAFDFECLEFKCRLSICADATGGPALAAGDKRDIHLIVANAVGPRGNALHADGCGIVADGFLPNRCFTGGKEVRPTFADADLEVFETTARRNPFAAVDLQPALPALPSPLLDLVVGYLNG